VTESTTSRVGRRAELREKRRKQRRRLVIAGGAAALVLIVLVTVVLVRNGGDDAKGTKEAVRTQRTLLFQIKGNDGTAVGSALLADDRSKNEGAVVLVPPQVLANVPGKGNLEFSQALSVGGVTGARNALADLMGVTIDGSWVLDGPTFAKLVDSVGGVSIDVDTTVLRGRTVLLNAGQQRLSGASALTFATYLAPGEQEQSRLPRLQAVLDEVLNQLPVDSLNLLGSLGPGSTSTLKVPDLNALVTGLEKDDKASNLQYQSLPVTPVQIDERQRFRVDADKVRELVDSLLAQSIPKGSRANGNRVLVLNGVGTPGLSEQVRAKLVPAGFVFVGQRNAPTFGYAKTIVLVPAATEEDAAVGAAVAKAIGVPAASVQASSEIGTVADVVVIVGADFKAK
jgi:hypothetical protein